MGPTPRLAQHLTSSPLGDELMVYDSHTEQAHCLSPQGRLVYQACERGDDLSQLGLDPAQVEVALGEFQEKGWLEATSRRSFLTGAAASAALAISASALAPRPASAVTCLECTLDANGFPGDCNDCGQPCLDIDEECDPANVCSFLFRRNNVNTTETGCRGGFRGGEVQESIGQFACRSTSQLTFNLNCDTARGFVGDGEEYHCCCCDGYAGTTTPAIPADTCCIF